MQNQKLPASELTAKVGRNTWELLNDSEQDAINLYNKEVAKGITIQELSFHIGNFKALLGVRKNEQLRNLAAHDLLERYVIFLTGYVKNFQAGQC